MTAGQTVVAATLWIVVLALMVLVLLLYRHVDHAYSGRSGFSRTAGLMPGVEVPPIEIVGKEGASVLRLPDVDEGRYLLAFVSAECAGCLSLLKILGEEKAFGGVAIAILVQPVPIGHPIPEVPPNVRMHGAASPADIRRHFGITFVPLVYVMSGPTVLAAGGGATEAELKELLLTARENEAEALANETEEIKVSTRHMTGSGA